MSESSRPNAKSQVIVLTLLHEGLAPSVVAERFGVSRRYVHYLLTRYKAGGLQALEPRSRRPRSNPRALTHELRSEITRLRTGLLAMGLDPSESRFSEGLRETGTRQHALVVDNKSKS